MPTTKNVLWHTLSACIAASYSALSFFNFLWRSCNTWASRTWKQSLTLCIHNSTDFYQQYLRQLASWKLYKLSVHWTAKLPEFIPAHQVRYPLPPFLKHRPCISIQSIQQTCIQSHNHVYWNILSIIKLKCLKNVPLRNFSFGCRLKDITQ